MKIETKFFGEIEIEREKILTFDHGLLGIENYKSFTIIYDSEEGDPIISWLQSTEDKNFALPIVNPLIIDSRYAPVVEDELLEGLGELDEDKILIFNILVIPEDVKKMTVNMKAPVIIHTETKKGQQIIVENEEYMVRYPVYEHIKKVKQLKEQKKGGE